MSAEVTPSRWPARLVLALIMVLIAVTQFRALDRIDTAAHSLAMRFVGVPQPCPVFGCDVAYPDIRDLATNTITTFAPGTTGPLFGGSNAYAGLSASTDTLRSGIVTASTIVAGTITASEITSGSLFGSTIATSGTIILGNSSGATVYAITPPKMVPGCILHRNPDSTWSCR